MVRYRAQESLLNVCDKYGVQLTLFHRRGGTTGRGGAPAHQALLSQPAGSLRSGLRVTERGEMIEANLDFSAIANKSLALYASAIAQANMLEPPKPDDQIHPMDELADISYDAYP